MHHSISNIAKTLTLRPKRILDKVHNLTIPVHYQDSVPYIDNDGLRILANEYVNSSRTSERTQQYARKLLAYLKEGYTDLAGLHSGIQKPDNNAKRLRKVGNPHQPFSSPDISKGIVNKILIVLSETVQSILATCVRSLESLYFKFFALLVSIFVQMHHTATWFYRTTPEESSSWAAAYGYAIMLDLFILVVTMEGKISIAKTFAVLTLISNLLYFQCWIGFDSSITSYARIVSASIISATIAFIIYSYTEIFVKYRKQL